MTFKVKVNAEVEAKIEVRPLWSRSSLRMRSKLRSDISKDGLDLLPSKISGS